MRGEMEPVSSKRNPALKMKRDGNVTTSFSISLHRRWNDSSNNRSSLQHDCGALLTLNRNSEREGAEELKEEDMGYMCSWVGGGLAYTHGFCSLTDALVFINAMDGNLP